MQDSVDQQSYMALPWNTLSQWWWQTWSWRMQRRGLWQQQKYNPGFGKDMLLTPAQHSRLTVCRSFWITWTIEPSIHFTVELELDDKLPFLDVLLQYNSDDSVLSTVYRKPTHTDGYVCEFCLHHPHKLAVIKTLHSIGHKPLRHQYWARMRRWNAYKIGHQWLPPRKYSATPSLATPGWLTRRTHEVQW